MNTDAEPLNLVAGPLALLFEPASAMLRYVRLGDVEVLRGVYVAVRDRNWDTIAPAVSIASLDVRPDSFAILFDVDCVHNGIDFYWRGSIGGGSDGTIVYRMSGEARRAFLRNRIGFCVLHPIRECAGRPCVVEHVGGELTRGVFPREISPHQPFLQMRSIRHSVTAAADALVAFAGDVFEMEDQRNWTDASYKTYSTPLELPFPVEIQPQDRVEQSVTLSLVERESGGVRSARTRTAAGAEPPHVAFTGRRLPPVGLCVASHGQSPSLRELDRLADLKLSHLQVDIRAGDSRSLAGLTAAARQAAALDASLDVAVTLGRRADEELSRVAEAIEPLRTQIAHCFVFHENEKSTSARWVELARRRLGPLLDHALFAGGSNAYFAELNRSRPDAAAMDAVAYSINPQVHASDDASLVESLEAQGETVRSAQTFCGGRPICVGPITLRPRFNPNATAAATLVNPGELPPEVDPRQCGLLTAAWTLGSLSELAAAGAARLTYFETTGWRGVMETEAGAPLPDRFPSVAGGVYPVYHVLADVGEFARGEIAPLDFGRPLEIRGAMLRGAAPRGGCRYRLLVANVSRNVQRIVLPPPANVGGASYRCRILDDRSAPRAVREPESFRRAEGVELAEHKLALPPYAYACLDVTGADTP